MINLDDNLLSRAELATRLGLSRQYLDALGSRHEGPPYVRIGRAIRYDRAQVAAWLETQAMPAAA